MDSIFTKIIKREIPGNFVYEDDQCVVITTIQPVVTGHVLVIPKQQVDHWYDLSDELAAHLLLVSKKVAKALQQVFPAERVGVFIAGFEVPHTHLHVLPVNNMGDFDISKAQFADSTALSEVARQLAQVMR